MNRLKKSVFHHNKRIILVIEKKLKCTRVIYPKPQSFIESRGLIQSWGTPRSGSSSLSSTAGTADIYYLKLKYYNTTTYCIMKHNEVLTTLAISIIYIYI
jgi:hypothetical protein